MEQIINDSLLLSEVKQGDLNISLVDITDITQKTIVRLQQQQPSRKVKFIIQPNVIAIADPSLLNHAIENRGATFYFNLGL